MVEWRQISNSNYDAGSDGAIRNRVTNHTLTPCLNRKTGYLQIELWINRKPVLTTVHKIIANTFWGAVPEGHQVNHKNGNKTDNSYLNLEYVTPKQNIRHAMELGLFQASYKGKPKKPRKTYPRISTRVYKFPRQTVNDMRWLSWLGYPLSAIATRYDLSNDGHLHNTVFGRRRSKMA